MARGCIVFLEILSGSTNDGLAMMLVPKACHGNRCGICGLFPGSRVPSTRRADHVWWWCDGRHGRRGRRVSSGVPVPFGYSGYSGSIGESGSAWTSSYEADHHLEQVSIPITMQWRNHPWMRTSKHDAEGAKYKIRDSVLGYYSWDDFSKLLWPYIWS